MIAPVHTHTTNTMTTFTIPARYYRQLIELDFIIEPTGKDDNKINVIVDRDDPMFAELHDLAC